MRHLAVIAIPVLLFCQTAHAGAGFSDIGILGSRSTLPANTVQPSLSRAALRIRAFAGAAIALGAGAYLAWRGDSLDLWPSLLLLAMVLAGACYYLWVRYLMSFYGHGAVGSPNSPAAPDGGDASARKEKAALSRCG